eukprot:CFRG5396T1
MRIKNLSVLSAALKCLRLTVLIACMIIIGLIFRSDLGIELFNEYLEKPSLIQTSYPPIIPQRGSVIPLSNVGEATVTCSNDVCVFENICVEKSLHRKENEKWFSTTPLRGYKKPLVFRVKDHVTKFDVETRMSTEDNIQLVHGTTVLFTVPTGNWFFNILNTFGIWMAVKEHTGKQDAHENFEDNESFTLMVLLRTRRVFSFPMSGAALIHRAIYPQKLGNLYDIRKSLFQDKDEPAVACFERAVVGFEMRGSLMTGSQMEHMEETEANLKELLKRPRLQQERRAELERRLEVHKENYRYLPVFRKHLLRNLDMESIPMEPKRVLLVSREAPRFNTGRAQYRKILNRDELINILEKRGYTVYIVDFASITVPEQIVEVRKAQLYIGMHGAGMANTMWLHEDACAIELHTYGFQKWGYEGLSKYLDQCYVSWVNTRQEDSKETWKSILYEPSNRDHWRSRDQVVNAEEFESTVEEAEVQMAHRVLHKKM